MTQPELSKAKDPDLLASMAAMRRAAKEARRISIQTGTGLMMVVDGRLTILPATQLQQQDDADGLTENSNPE